MARSKVDQGKVVLPADKVDEVASKVSKVRKARGAAWNKRIWFSVPELRQEPFTDMEDVRTAVWTASNLGETALVVAFPSREAARKLEGIENMPSEVLYRYT